MHRFDFRGNPHLPLYEVVAGRIQELVDNGTFRPGDRVPSLRELARQLRVSLNTVKEAYGFLEDRRVLEARPQSGFYVRPRLPDVPRAPGPGAIEVSPIDVSIDGVVRRILRDIQEPGLIRLGAAIPNPELLPVARLGTMLSRAARSHQEESFGYAVPPGNPRLRTQVARRLLQSGCTLAPDEVVVTSGCMEAIALALQAVCRPGDTLAVESPTYYNLLLLIQELGLRALEIPCTPGAGMCLETLRYALDQTTVSAVLVIGNYNNPLGSLMPDTRKRELVALLEERRIPLVEDDIYGDLSFTDDRPRVAKAWDRTGNVLLCSSFSKTLAPGYRVGWIAPGRYLKRVEQLKMTFNVASASPTQLAIARFLEEGGYDRHLRTIRRVYARKVAQLAAAIGRHFPEGTRVTRPAGGFVLWVEMPPEVDTLELYRLAAQRGISVAPGPIFSPTGRYRNCLRLNAAFWSEQVEGAIATLGQLAGRPV